MTKISGVFEPSTVGSKCEVFVDTIRATIRGNTRKTAVLPEFNRIVCGSAERCILPVYFPAIVVNPPERKLEKHTSVQWQQLGQWPPHGMRLGEMFVHIFRDPCVGAELQITWRHLSENILKKKVCT